MMSLMQDQPYWKLGSLDPSDFGLVHKWREGLKLRQRAQHIKEPLFGPNFRLFFCFARNMMLLS